eukprot:gene424-6837_t
MKREKTTLTFEGQNFCGICGGEFACSDSQFWNDGLKKFQSPVSSNYKVWSSFGQIFFQHDDCSATSNLTVTLNDYVVGNNYNITAGCECGSCSVLDFGDPTGNFEFSSVFNETNTLKITPSFKDNKGSICVNRVDLYFCSLPENFNVSDVDFIKGEPFLINSSISNILDINVLNHGPDEVESFKFTQEFPEQLKVVSVSIEFLNVTKNFTNACIYDSPATNMTNCTSSSNSTHCVNGTLVNCTINPNSTFCKNETEGIAEYLELKLPINCTETPTLCDIIICINSTHLNETHLCPKTTNNCTTCLNQTMLNCTLDSNSTLCNNQSTVNCTLTPHLCNGKISNTTITNCTAGSNATNCINGTMVNCTMNPNSTFCKNQTALNCTIDSNSTLCMNQTLNCTLTPHLCNNTLNSTVNNNTIVCMNSTHLNETHLCPNSTVNNTISCIDYRPKINCQINDHSVSCEVHKASWTKDAILRIQTSVVNPIQVRGTFRLKTGLNITSGNILNPDNAIAYQRIIFFSPQKYELQENQKIIGYQFGDVSDLVTISFVGVESSSVIVIKLYLIEPIPVIVQFIFSSGATQTTESKVEDFVKELYDGSYTVTLSINPDLVASNSFVNIIVKTKITVSSELIQFTIQYYKRPLNLVTLGNSLKAVEMKAFDWSFFKVTFSSDTAVLSITLEGASGETLDVFLSPTFQYTWSKSTSSKVEFNDNWTFKDSNREFFTYYLAVYGIKCPLKCKFSYKAFLTDDTTISVLTNVTYFFVRNDTLSTNLHYISKLDFSNLEIDQSIKIPRFFKIGLNFLSGTIQTPKTIGYLKGGDFPVMNSYDIKFEEDCFSAATIIVPFEDILIQKVWYFGYIFCCSGTLTTITLSIYEPKIFNPKRKNLIEIDSTFDNIFGIDFATKFKENGLFASQFSIGNVSINSTFFAKFDSTPSDTSYDFKFQILFPQYEYVNITNTMTNETELVRQVIPFGAENYFRLQLLVESDKTRFRICDGHGSKGGFQVISNQNLLINSTLKKLFFKVQTKDGYNCPKDTNYRLKNIESDFFQPHELKLGQRYEGEINPGIEQYSPIYFKLPLTDLKITEESNTIGIEVVFFNLPFNSSLLLNKTQMYAKLDEYPFGNSSDFQFSNKILEYQFNGQKLFKMTYFLQLDLPINSTMLKALFLMLDNNRESNKFEIAIFTMEQNSRISSSTTSILPGTYSSVMLMTGLGLIVIFLMVIGLGFKLYEKHTKRRLINFNLLKSNDPFCFVFYVWFKIFGNISRKAKQIQLCLVGLFFVFIGVLIVVTFAIITINSFTSFNCCSQINDHGYKTQTVVLSLNLPSACFSDSQYEIPSISKPSSELTNYGKYSAILFCFRGDHYRLYVRGNDIFGVIGATVGGFALILGFTIFATLLIEIFLGTWFCELKLFPKFLSVFKED